MFSGLSIEFLSIVGHLGLITTPAISYVAGLLSSTISPIGQEFGNVVSPLSFLRRVRGPIPVGLETKHHGLVHRPSEVLTLPHPFLLGPLKQFYQSVLSIYGSFYHMHKVNEQNTEHGPLHRLLR